MSVVGPTRAYLLDSFYYSGIQFYILLSPFHCFIFFLFLDWYLTGDDTSISQGSFMRIKSLFVLNNIWNKGEVGTIKLV